jgi:hypothetical protein
MSLTVRKSEEESTVGHGVKPGTRRRGSVDGQRFEAIAVYTNMLYQSEGRWMYR